MNAIKKTVSSRLLACCFGALLPTLVQADDTEIYFAQANADNSQNQTVANVMIMLDTSGSMRFCEESLGGSGYDADWCSDASNRRINLLQNALDELLDSVSPAVRIGLARFNYNAPNSSSGSGGTGQLGGRIIVPVTALDSDTKALIRSHVGALNDAGENSSHPNANAQPVGDTPTARAYSEVARYMMGMPPNYHSSNGGQNAVCALEEQVETNCREEIVYGDPYSVDSCDINSSQYICSRTGWKDLPDWQTCDLSSPDCQTRSDWRGWTDYSRSRSCNTSRYWCQESWGRYRQRIFQTAEYLRQDPTGATRRVCDVENQCTKPLEIVRNGSFVSPINSMNQCETNHVILFTDGAPSSNDKPSNVGVVNCNGADSYSCQRAIASYLNNPGNARSRPVYTHNIGLYMGDNEENMRSVSDAGAGQTSNADSAEALVEAFLDNLDLIDEQARSLSAPGVAVNAMNRFQHLDQLYYSVFQPFESSYWDGNLKRYKLVDGEIHGANGGAIDPATGYFHDGSRSIWSDVTDGPDVTKGGAREQVGSRRLFYTDAGNTLRRMNWESTDTPSNTFLGLSATATAERRAALMAELQVMWGDPLHSVPVMVNYGEDEENNYVFVSNNGGMLHGIDTKTGEETFAFMPYEFISQADKYTVNRQPLGANNKRQTYGLDGSWVAWRKSGDTAMDAPEAVYIYGGMRRGGRSYYALDVTDPDSPSMLWRVSNENSAYARLGQTWSTPTLTSAPISEEVTSPILVVGGGYSPVDHDDGAALSGVDQMGNAVYFIDAQSGEKLWSASASSGADATVSEMKWAIPSSVAVVDMDFDGVADHMYFGDMAGQIFRIDIKADGNHSVVRIADLGGSGADRTRFYEAPAVGYVRENGENHLYVTIGSGYRAHPLDELTNDGFFVIKDDSALEAKSTTVARRTNLTNVTAGGLPATDDRGWYYTFDRTGEKALASPVIFDGRILFTTYAPTPDEEDDNPCAVRFGRSYLHTVNLMTAQPAALSDELPSPAERSQELDQSTPAPTPTLIVDADGRVITIVGTEVVGEGDLGDPRLRKRRWMQLTPDDANNIRQPEETDEGN